MPETKSSFYTLTSIFDLRHTASQKDRSKSHVYCCSVMSYRHNIYFDKLIFYLTPTCILLMVVDKAIDIHLSYLYISLYEFCPCMVSLVVSVSASHTVGHEFASRPGHTKDHHQNGTNCLPAWHAML